MTVLMGANGGGGFSMVSPTETGSFNPALHQAPPNHEMKCGNVTYKADSDGNIASAGGGYRSNPPDLTWHHHQDARKIQLVESVCMMPIATRVACPFGEEAISDATAFTNHEMISLPQTGKRAFAATD